MKVLKHPIAGLVTEPTRPNEYGAVFRARLLRQGERYGLEFGLVHAGGEPLVEWYDARFDDRFPFPGQFVARYHITILVSAYPEFGLFGSHGEQMQRGPLVLDGGERSWSVPESEVRAVLSALLVAWRKGDA